VLLPRCLRIIPVVIASAFLVACRSEVNVAVKAAKDGSGHINVEAVLDKDAAAVFRDRTPALVTDDLKKDGWIIGGPAATPDGGLRIVADHAFETPNQANQLLASLTGQNGAFSKLKLTRSSAYITSTLKLNGSVDLSKGLSGFGDEKLRALTGSTSNLGIDDVDIEQQAKGKLNDSFALQFEGNLGSEKKIWALPLGANTNVSLSAQSWSLEVFATFLTGVSAIVGLFYLWRTTRGERKAERKAEAERLAALAAAANSGGASA
jgi:hypothetical protein